MEVGKLGGNCAPPIPTPDTPCARTGVPLAWTSCSGWGGGRGKGEGMHIQAPPCLPLDQRWRQCHEISIPSKLHMCHLQLASSRTAVTPQPERGFWMSTHERVPLVEAVRMAPSL